MKEPLCPFCYNGWIEKVQGIYICRICFKQVKIKDNGIRLKVQNE